jgi:ABC-type sugar transport system ATPase subunit
MGIRPEHVTHGDPGTGDMDARVELKESLGGDSFLYVTTAAGDRLVVRAGGDAAIRAGDHVGLGFPAGRLHFFGADGRTLASGGEPA